MRVHYMYAMPSMNRKTHTTHTQSGKITLCNHINVILYTKRVRIKNNCYHFVSTVHFDTELFLLINNTLFLVFKESFGERLLFLPA